MFRSVEKYSFVGSIHISVVYVTTKVLFLEDLIQYISRVDMQYRCVSQDQDPFLLLRACTLVE